MGWADCGTDTKQRPIGYAFEATCDEPGCTAKIDRGLSYACGGMHGEDEVSCENYFCAKHRYLVETTADGPANHAGRNVFSVCAACMKTLADDGFLVD